MKNNNKKGRLGKGMLAAAAVAAAGYYFYASKDAKKNRRAAAAWAGELKKTVIENAQKVKNVDRKTLSAIVDEAAKAYKGMRDLDRGEVERAARELKDNWHKIAKELTKSGAKATRTVKKAVRKMTPKKR